MVCGRRKPVCRLMPVPTSRVRTEPLGLLDGTLPRGEKATSKVPCWWIRQIGIERMARSVSELQAWADLLELCEDDCRVFETTKKMRSAVLEVERELCRLHKVEDAAA